MFKKISVFILVLAFSVCMANTVKADTDDTRYIGGKTYLGIFGLATLPAGLDLNPDELADSRREYRLRNKLGYGGGVAFGYDFGGIPYSFAVEVQAAYLLLRPDSIQQRDITTATEGSWSNVPGLTIPATEPGNNNSLVFMVAGRFTHDYNIMMRPYVVLGIGMAQIKSTVLVQYSTATDNSTAAAIPIFQADANSKYVFAYAAGFGMEYVINEGFALDIAYRYFGTLSGADLTLSAAPTDAQNVTNGGASADNIAKILRSDASANKVISPKYHSHMISIGAKLSF